MHASVSPRARRATAIAGVAMVLFSSCTGAGLLTDGHLAYNEAVRRASDEELLLNIVRLRYLDSVEFLSTASINSSVRFSVGLDAGYSNDEGDVTGSGGLSFGYSSWPTFFLLTEAFRFNLDHDVSDAPVLTLPVGS
jgi:hypothetical protein